VQTRHNGYTSLIMNHGTKYRSKNAFTLAEILIVVIILSILTTTALTQYNRVMRQENFRKAKMVGMSLHSTNVIYRAENNKYIESASPGVALTSIEEINTAFGTGFIHSRPFATYSYTEDRSSIDGYAVIEIQFFDNDSDLLYSLEFWNAQNGDPVSLGANNPLCTPAEKPCPDV